MGAHVDIAVDKGEALTLLRENPYDLIFLDLDISGIDLIEQIRKQEKRHTIIISLTEDASEEERDEALESGSDDYLIKPIRLDLLEEILHEYVVGLTL